MGVDVTAEKRIDSTHKSSYVNYYSWDLAVGGVLPNADNGSVALYSICPKNWKLIRNSGSKSIRNLVSYYGSSSSVLSAKPVSLIYTSAHDSSGGITSGMRSSYWLPICGSTDQANNFSLSSSGGNISYSETTGCCNTKRGFPIRCLSK